MTTGGFFIFGAVSRTRVRSERRRCIRRRAGRVNTRIALATKYLARTVIEGGRSYHNTYERRSSHGRLRSADRAYLDRVTADPTLSEGSAPARLRKVRKDFHDKLGPARRWLRSRVGKEWDETFAL